MWNTTHYNPTLFAQDIQNSAYQLPVLAQRYLRRARILRLEPVKEVTGEQKARLRYGVQWFVASMAYAVRPRTDEQRFMVLTHVLMADESLQAIMDTAEKGLFIPDDWISMFGLLTDELSFSDFGDLSLEIFKPFVGWMESRPPATTNATTPSPTLSKSVELIEPPPLFLPSPAVNFSSSKKLKRARPVSPSIAEAQCSKRLKVGHETPRPSPDDVCKDVSSLKVVPVIPSSVFAETGSDKVSQATNALGPTIALAPAVWRVSSSSPLATQTPRFSSPDHSVTFNDPAPIPFRVPTPPCEKKERKSVSSRSKFTPSRNSGSSSAPINKFVTSGKLESSSISVVVGRPDPMCKTVPKLVLSRTSVSRSVSTDKSVASRGSNSSSKSASSREIVLSSKSASSSKSSVLSGAGKSTSKSASSSKFVAPEKSTPSRKSGSNCSRTPQTPQPNCLNLQRRLIIMSPPSRPPKSTHRI